MNTFRLSIYNFIKINRTIKSKGCVAMYIRDNIQFKFREDLSTLIDGTYVS